MVDDAADDAPAPPSATAETLTFSFPADPLGTLASADVVFEPGETVDAIAKRTMALGAVPCYAEATLRATLEAYLAARAEVRGARY